MSYSAKPRIYQSEYNNTTVPDQAAYYNEQTYQSADQTADYITAQREANDNQYHNKELPEMMVIRPEVQPEVPYQQQYYKSDQYDQHMQYGAHAALADQYQQHPMQDGYQSYSHVDPYQEQYSSAQYPVHDHGYQHTPDKSYQQQQHPSQYGSNTAINTQNYQQSNQYEQNNTYQQDRATVQTESLPQDNWQTENKFTSNITQTHSLNYDDMDISDGDENYFTNSNEQNPYGGILGENDLPDTESDDNDHEYTFTVQESRAELIQPSEADKLYPPCKQKPSSHQWYKELEHHFPADSILHNLITFIPINDILLRNNFIIRNETELSPRYLGINKHIFTTGHRYNVWMDPADNKYLCFRKVGP